ncbi:MAG: hypothetical protein KIT79_10165 [Deltaproteobacteria bacterium]|nr:hypothetical protein [Deltaproteobacteria bacterium]
MPVIPTGYCQTCRDEVVLWTSARSGRLHRFCLNCDEPVSPAPGKLHFRPEHDLERLGYSFAEPPPPVDTTRHCGSGGCSSCGSATGGGCSSCSKAATCHAVH